MLHGVSIVSLTFGETSHITSKKYNFLIFLFLQKKILQIVDFYLNRNIAPTENKFVAFMALGEGWHNYHHVFPWDYKTSELGNYGMNCSTALIDMFAKIGWAYDLKQPPKELIRKMIQEKGDGSHSTEQLTIKPVLKLD